ncbi:MAG: (2Fe-2S)-binding protein [Gemmatimonadaceae bacterium]
MPVALEIHVNGRRHVTHAVPTTPLLYVLRNELELNGPKFGCGVGECGACTVLLGGKATRSCITPVAAAANAPVTTVEGLGTPDAPHPLQRAFVEEQAAQCGYCINGMIMTAAALLVETPRPSSAQIRTALAGNLCRCGTHLRILRAIERVSAAQSTERG